jgi:hypothetical protein
MAMLFSFLALSGLDDQSLICEDGLDATMLAGLLQLFFAATVFAAPDIKRSVM